MPPTPQTDLRERSFEAEYGPVTPAPSLIGDWVEDEKDYQKWNALLTISNNTHRGLGFLFGAVLGFALFVALFFFSILGVMPLQSPFWVLVFCIIGGSVIGVIGADMWS